MILQSKSNIRFDNYDYDYYFLNTVGSKDPEVLKLS